MRSSTWMNTDGYNDHMLIRALESDAENNRNWGGGRSGKQLAEIALNGR